MRKLILNLHLAIGLVAGAFVIVLGVTGAVLAFEPELDRSFHRDTSHVKPAGKALSLVEIGNAISRKYPGEGIVAYLPSTEADFPTQVILSRGIVSVDQYTGEVLGVRTRGQTFLGIVRALHVRLAMGNAGREILKWSSLGTTVSLLSGLYLWWPVKRMWVGGHRWSARFWYDLHSSVGFFSFFPALVLAATGAMIGFEDQAAWLLGKASSSATVGEQHTALPPKSLTGETQINPDQAVAMAVSRLPGSVPGRVQMPRYGGSYVVTLEFTRDRVTGDRNSVSLDPLTGRIVSTHFSPDLTLRERFMAANGKIHDGTIWGLPTKIVAALSSILLPVQVVSGLLIWLRRKGILRAK